jgi:RNA polymerase-binding transcription factor DksA
MTRVCKECGEEITRKRLKALPFTKICLECAEESERENPSASKYKMRSTIISKGDDIEEIRTEIVKE